MRSAYRLEVKCLRLFAFGAALRLRNVVARDRLDSWPPNMLFIITRAYRTPVYIEYIDTLPIFGDERFWDRSNEGRAVMK